MLLLKLFVESVFWSVWCLKLMLMNFIVFGMISFEWWMCFCLFVCVEGLLILKMCRFLDGWCRENVLRFVVRMMYCVMLCCCVDFR